MVAWHLRQLRENGPISLPVLVASVWVICWGAAVAWPTSWWFDVRSVRVFDAVAGDPVQMAVDREIRRPFVASWDVAVRRVSGESTEIVCAAAGSGDYRRDSVLPDPLYLGWWTWDECAVLEPGSYIVSTGWAIKVAPMLPKKSIRVDSNIFTVAASGL